MKLLILTTLLLIILCFSSCITTHNDCALSFVVHSEVYNKSNKTPISEAKIIFIDTGFGNDKGLKRFIPKVIGKSDTNGQISIKFDYFYSYNSGWFYEKPQNTFEIHIVKETFKEKTLILKKTDFNYEAGELLVELPVIYLEKEKLL